MVTRQLLTVLLLTTLTLVQQCQGHGYLLDPPGRSSMWRVSRFKRLVEPNYSDMGLRCGGSRTSCGVCGDPVNGPFENEAGGIYARGIIAKQYTEGQRIRVSVVVTANHEGWFEFHLCPNNDVTKKVTEECLQRNLLKLPNGDTRWYLQAHKYGRQNMEVFLPEGVTCSQCVFRWKWITKITGFEQFYGCSDVSIAPREGVFIPETPKPTMYITEAPETEAPVTEAPVTEAPVTEAPETEAPETEAPETEAPETEAPVTEAPETEAPETEAPETEAPETEAPETEAPETEAPETEAPATEAPATEAPGKPWKPVVDGVRVPLTCRGVMMWRGNDEMDEWCNQNCNNYIYNCPTQLCECQHL